MIIKIDVDGVIRDVISAICLEYNKEFGKDIKPSDVVEYNINGFFPLVSEKHGIKPSDYYFLNKGKEIFGVKSRPFRNVKKAIELFKKNGHKTVIVTWQLNDENKKHTLEFLKENEIYFDDIVFTRDKFKVKGDVLIDDNPEFLLDKRDTSIKICVSRPYNRSLKNVARAKSLFDAAKLLLR